MAYYTLPDHGYSQVAGLGYAQAIAAILGPLVEGGAAAYAVHEGAKTGRKELRQRRVEFQLSQQLAQEQLRAQERQQGLAQQAAVQQAQISQAYGARRAPLIVSALGIGALALVAVALLRGKG